LRSFEESLPDLTSRGIRVVAISADPPDVLRAHLAKTGWTFTFLADPRTEVIRRYGLLHPKGGANGADIALPAELLIDPTGTIRWVDLTDDYRVRARPEAVLAAYDRLTGRASLDGPRP
jgi:peroxiredoxin